MSGRTTCAETRTPDLSWRADGMFTRFLPNTKAGEDAWRVLAEHTEGTGKVFSHHTADFIRQLRAKGYTVAKEPPRNASSELDDDALLAELLGTQLPPQS